MTFFFICIWFSILTTRLALKNFPITLSFLSYLFVFVVVCCLFKTGTAFSSHYLIHFSSFVYLYHLNSFTSWQAFRNVLREINDLAGQREVIAESFQSQVINAITLLSKNLRDERKKSLNDGATYQQNLAVQFAALDRAKRNYEKSYRDSEKAKDSFQRADADYNLSRAEVEKQRQNMNFKLQQSEEAKNEYANQLQKTNNLQKQHYEVALPDVFNRLQEIDEKRTGGIKEFIKLSADVELSVAPIIARCLDGVSKAAESIDEKQDSQMVIEKYVRLYPSMCIRIYILT